jgi:cellulose synthase/poly-beta-1,6-N-acetylglucosamine synthase-like glycosyltransferase
MTNLLSSTDRVSATTVVVSVVIPARNAAASLDATLWSVRQQTFAHWEVVVVNDGSTDATAEVVQRHRREDARIRCVNGRSRGVSAARNLGVASSEGPVIAFLDADDLWLPGKLAAHVDFLGTQPEVGMAFDRIRFVDAQARPTPVLSTSRVHGLHSADLLYENPACTASTLVMRREAFEQIGGFDETLNHAEDLEMMIRLRATTAWRLEGLSEVLTHYRASAQGASAGLQRMQDGWERVMGKVQQYAPELLRTHGRHARAVHQRYLARRALRLGLPAQEGLHWWRLAWRNSPSALLRQPRRSLGTLLGLLASAAGQRARQICPSVGSAA